MKFYKWYSQAIGSVVGMIFCIYCYIHGDLLLYSNISGNYDILSFNKIIASYSLYPLCILTFFMALLIPILNNYETKKALGIQVSKINLSLKYLTSLIGLLGCTIYFILPAAIILFSDILILVNYLHNKLSKKALTNNKEFTKENEENNEEAQLNPLLTNEIISEEECLSTKTEIAIHLLNKDSNIDFIKEITGLPLEYLNKLEKENLHSSNKK